MTEYDIAHHMLAARMTIEADISLRVECTAPEGAKCRLTCDSGCEEFSYEDHEHALVDAGHCQLTTFLEMQDMVESYDGPTMPLASGNVLLTYHPLDMWVSWRYPDADELSDAQRVRVEAFGIHPELDEGDR